MFIGQVTLSSLYILEPQRKHISWHHAKNLAAVTMHVRLVLWKPSRLIAIGCIHEDGQDVYMF